MVYSITMKKTILTVPQEIHLGVKSAARTHGHTVTKLTAILLGYALNKLEGGQLTLVAPRLVEGKAK